MRGNKSMRGKKSIWIFIGAVIFMLLMTACGNGNAEKSIIGRWAGNDMEDGKEFLMEINEDHTIILTYDGESSNQYSWEYRSGKWYVSNDEITLELNKPKNGSLHLALIDKSNGGKGYYEFDCTKLE